MLITALVYCTGGSHSIFGFVYIGWIVYVATQLGPGGAITAAGLSMLLHGYTVTGLALGWLEGELEERSLHEGRNR